MFVLIGIVIVVLGFALRLNQLLVVAVAALATGLAAEIPFNDVVAIIGEKFTANRALSLFILTLPIIGLMERYGLKEKAQSMIRQVKSATTGGILIIYLFIREVAAIFGLTSLGGHPQMVRPLVAPMAEAAAENKYGKIPPKLRNKIRAYSASADNVGLFFGEDIFIAFGAVILMKGFFAERNIILEPWDIAKWGIPTAIAAFVIHASRLYLFDQQIKKQMTSIAKGGNKQ